MKPFVKSNKNDYLDAEAIADAVQRPTMRFVPAKSVEQLDLQALHRVRERLVSRWTAVIKPTLLGMSKRGNSHLRWLFIHGARSASMHMMRDHGLGP